MIRGLYSAATALETATRRQEVTAENLAHLSTPGYRAKGLVFESFEQTLERAGAASGVRATDVWVDFQAGAMRATGSPYHLAIEGDAFFALEGPKGTVYTRNGSFHLAPDGRLLSDSGYPVQGSNGPITLPADVARVTIGRDGSISADGVPAGQVRLTRFESPGRLRQVGPTLFEAPVEAGEAPATSGVMQGFLETSNVTPAGAMIDMIQASRSFEAAQRALRSIAEILQLNTRQGN